MHSIFCIGLIVSIFGLANSSQAQELAALRLQVGASANVASPSNPLKIQLAVEIRALTPGQINCGLELDFGDGTTRQLATGSLQSPISIEHEYRQGGPRTVSIQGVDILTEATQAFACSGTKRSLDLLVRSPPVAAPLRVINPAAPGVYSTCLLALYGEHLPSAASAWEAFARARISCAEQRTQALASLEERYAAKAPGVMRDLEKDLLQELQIPIPARVRP
jgi:hypothetical protein